EEIELTPRGPWTQKSAAVGCRTDARRRVSCARARCSTCRGPRTDGHSPRRPGPAVPWLLGKGGTSEYGSYVKRRPPDGAATAWAAPHTVCAGYAPPPMYPVRRIAPR